MSGPFFDGAFFGGGFYSPLTAPVAPAGPTPAGGRRRRPVPYPILCTVEGEERFFDSLAALMSFLEALAEKKEREVSRVAKKAAKRIIATGRIAPEQEQVPLLRVLDGPDEARVWAAEQNARLERMYWTAIYRAWEREEAAREEEQDVKAIAELDL